MPTVVVTLPRRGYIVSFALNLAVALYNGSELVQGSDSTAVIVFTVIPGFFALILFPIMLRPPQIRVEQGRFFVRLPIQLSTPVDNMKSFSFDGKLVRVLLHDANRATTDSTGRHFVEKTFQKKGVHLEVHFPMTPEQYRSLLTALGLDPH
jgi:ABC-type microcin C transport system permease subunit YejB